MRTITFSNQTLSRKDVMTVLGVSELSITITLTDGQNLLETFTDLQSYKNKQSEIENLLNDDTHV